jgi:hypothetical protein
MEGQRFIATNLEATIAAQGRTKRWVAKQAGFSESMLAHVLAGRKTIGRQAAEKVALALGVPFFVLFESAPAYETFAEAIIAEAIPA